MREAITLGLYHSPIHEENLASYSMTLVACNVLFSCCKSTAALLFRLSVPKGIAHIHSLQMISITIALI